MAPRRSARLSVNNTAKSRRKTAPQTVPKETPGTTHNRKAAAVNSDKPKGIAKKASASSKKTTPGAAKPSQATKRSASVPRGSRTTAALAETSSFDNQMPVKFLEWLGHVLETGKVISNKETPTQFFEWFSRVINQTHSPDDEAPMMLSKLLNRFLNSDSPAHQDPPGLTDSEKESWYNPSRDHAFNQQWNATRRWDVATLLAAWSSLSERITTLASLLANELPKGSSKESTKCFEKDLAKFSINPGRLYDNHAKAREWLFEAYLWRYTLGDTEPYDVGSDTPGTTEKKAYQAFKTIDRTIRDYEPNLHTAFGAEYVLWEALSMRMLFAALGDYSTDDRAADVVFRIVRNLCSGVTGRTPYDKDVSDEVTAMTKQVAAQAVRVKRLLAAVPFHCEVTWGYLGGPVDVPPFGVECLVLNGKPGKDGMIELFVKPGLSIRRIDCPPDIRTPKRGLVHQEPAHVVVDKGQRRGRK